MLNKNKEHTSTEENNQEQQQNSFVTSLIHFPSPYRWESGLPSFHQTPMGYLKARGQRHLASEQHLNF